MLLYNFAGSPSPRRARMLFSEKGLNIEMRNVDLSAAEHLHPNFLAINPRATVPVLMTEAGTALTENTAIASYIEDKFPNPPMMGEGAEEKAAVQMWNAICETQGFTAAAEALRNSESFKAGRAITGPVNFDRIPELALRGRRRAEFFFDQIEARLTESVYLASDRFTFADITGFVVCEFLRRVEISIPATKLASRAWHEKIAARPSASV